MLARVVAVVSGEWRVAGEKFISQNSQRPPVNGLWSNVKMIYFTSLNRVKQFKDNFKQFFNNLLISLIKTCILNINI